MSGENIIELYHMGVQLPQFLLWRQVDPVKNGDIPPATSVLRQALLGVGTVLLRVPTDQVPNLTGNDIANRAEKNGDLVGDQMFPEMPQMVCPASPDMIAGLGDALLQGNTRRGVSTLLHEYGVDIKKLRDFVAYARLHNDYEAGLINALEQLYEETPVVPTKFSLQKPPTKVERFDAIMTAYGRFLDEQQERVYASLDRTDKPPRMNLRRLYATRKELLLARVQALQSDDPTNLTREALADFAMLMPAGFSLLPLKQP
jgi:hypothetical protein